VSRAAVIEVVTTFPDEAAAVASAERLVAAGLAACVQVEGPILSLYRWEGRLEQAREWRCTCKTTPGTLAACIDAIVAGHPYEVPQVLWRECGAAAPYASWVAGHADGSGA